MEYRKPAGFLPKPVVTFDREDGQTVSAYMKLREGVKAAGAMQPSPGVMVFLLVADDGVPVGISFHEPAGGVAVCEMVDSLVEGLAGSEGVGLLTEPRDVSAFVKALRETLIGMENPTESRVP